MSHLKIQKIPKNWPVKRKGSAYVVRPNSNLQNGMPILVILRDILGIANKRKEVKKAIHSKHILLNWKVVIDEKNSATLFDVITVIPSKKSYRIELSEKGKMQVNEIKESEANKKVSKIINKKTLKGKKTQINLSDGRNFISDIKGKVNDSVLINLKDKKIEKCLALEEKKKIIVFSGKHAGEKGVINKIDSENKLVEVDIEGKNVNILNEQLMVVE